MAHLNIHISVKNTNVSCSSRYQIWRFIIFVLHYSFELACPFEFREPSRNICCGELFQMLFFCCFICTTLKLVHFANTCHLKSIMAALAPHVTDALNMMLLWRDHKIWGLTIQRQTYCPLSTPCFGRNGMTYSEKSRPCNRASRAQKNRNRRNLFKLASRFLISNPQKILNSAIGETMASNHKCSKERMTSLRLVLETCLWERER